MITIPEDVLKAWNEKTAPVVLTTISNEGQPNSIYATCVSMFGKNQFLIADNKFDKTLKNILACDKASILFITDDKKAFQLKGSISYQKEGAEFDDMKKWNPPHLAGKGVAILDVEEVFSGAEKLA